MSYAVIPHQNIASFPEHPVDHGLNSLSLGQLVIYGNYRTLINGVYHEDILPDIIFHTSYGEAITMGPSFTFFCAVEHPWWGTGQVTGVMKSWDNDDGTFTVKTTSTQYYPSTIGEANNKYIDGQCHDLTLTADNADDYDTAPGTFISSSNSLILVISQSVSGRYVHVNALNSGPRCFY